MPPSGPGARRGAYTRGMTTPSEVASRVAALERNVSKVVLGKADAVRLVLTGLLGLRLIFGIMRSGKL